MLRIPNRVQREGTGQNAQINDHVAPLTKRRLEMPRAVVYALGGVGKPLLRWLDAEMQMLSGGADTPAGNTVSVFLERNIDRCLVNALHRSSNLLVTWHLH